MIFKWLVRRRYYRMMRGAMTWPQVVKMMGDFPETEWIALKMLMDRHNPCRQFDANRLTRIVNISDKILKENQRTSGTIGLDNRSHPDGK
jgi:hypothetical protein